MRVSLFTVLVSLLAVAARGDPPSTRTGVEAFVGDITHVAVKLSYFTPEKYDYERSLDLSVVADGEPADAEGLMTGEQAARLLKVLEKNHFFGRAQPLAGAAWGPQTDAFYILTTEGAGTSVYEKLPIDLKTGRLLVAMRESLGKGPAAITIDKLAGDIDPDFRRWKVKPATLPTAAMLAPLPPGESKLHPGHRFAAIDPEAKLETLFIRPDEKGGHWIAAQFADPKECYVSAEYRLGTSNTPMKRVTYFPSGKVFAESDDRATHIDMLPAKGDAWERRFDESGAIVYYAHWHDGQCVDGWSIDGGREERVVDGKGTLTCPEIGGAPTHETFGPAGSTTKP